MCSEECQDCTVKEEILRMGMQVDESGEHWRVERIIDVAKTAMGETLLLIRYAVADQVGWPWWLIPGAPGVGGDGGEPPGHG